MVPQVSQGGEGEAQLALDEADLRLPWLEAADEDDDEGLDWSRVGRFVAFFAGFVLLAALAFWLLRDWQLAPPEGDGSVIAAPDAPYKVRPENPGGKTFAGTGDTSYKVGEGIEREARIAQKQPDPEPAAPAAAEEPAPASEPRPQVFGVGVQIGAYSTEAAAQKGWQTLTQRYQRLGDFDRRIIEGRADIGTVFRLQAVTGSTASANALCSELKANGIECQVKR
ncbi:SPOR domain-containing protein [Croceicoccus marinus]|uniref:SPOR domain-containing protein n=1 Tax=Croceicoccus marinus TaxID=450378 RepID=UPI0009FD9DB6|nr:SPOR domain-containing protein [Croceicoccus marinus]